jgi:DNA repair protein RadC
MPRSLHSLAVRSNRGHINPRADTFSTDFVRPSESGPTPVRDSEIVSAALEILAKRIATGSIIQNMEDAKKYLAVRFAGLEHEVFAIVYLTNRHQVIACEELFRGTIDGASVHPREVVKSALQYNAAALLIAHPHPSGIAEPSAADELITRRLKSALALVDIRIIDHLVIAGDQAVSFAERGLL